MFAVVSQKATEIDDLVWREVPDPEPGRGEVLIDVVASGINRGDINQRRGRHDPPPGASTILGLEVSGTVSAVGAGVREWQVGQPVCALLSGGGYAEKVVAPAGQVLPVPDGIDLIAAASLPETACTVWSNVVQMARLGAGEVLLVHGGSGGIGTHAIQVGAALGATVIVTAGTPERLQRCAELGADIVVNYRTEDFVEVVKDRTGGRGVDVILDNMGGGYLSRNIAALAVEGRLMIIGLQGGADGTVDVLELLEKRATVSGTGLRSRPKAQKAAIVADVVEHLWPLVAAGAVKPVMSTQVPMQEAAAAHDLLLAGDVFGKILLIAPAGQGG